jgi:hypothetical protein
MPAIWTINRIIKRQGLLTIVAPHTYPALQPTEPLEVHQLDLVGPRYLKSKERFYGMHLIDGFINAVPLPARVTSISFRPWLRAAGDWGFPISFRSITNSRFEASIDIHAARDY